MTRRSLALAAYLALSGGPIPRAGGGAQPNAADLWLHADTIESGRAFARLSQRLTAQRPEITIAATGEVPEVPEIVGLPTPPERRGACEAFAASLGAAFGIWAGPTLRPALIDAVARSGTEIVHIDTGDGPWPTPSSPLLPDPAAATLALFARHYATSERAQRGLRRAGVEAGRIRVLGPLRDGAPPRDCDGATHEALAARLAGRPIWLAAGITQAEAATVISAHRAALRLTHRLLLIAVPRTEADSADLTRIASAEGLRTCRFDAGDQPDEYAQILLTEGPEELPLWYRLAPLCLLGDSLLPGGGGMDPFEAAACGAALLYGPHVGAHLAAYSALVEAGAARIVRDAESLAAAVGHLVAPDQAAVMAHAGWSVVSAGAELADTLIADACTAIDAAQEAR